MNCVGNHDNETAAEQGYCSVPGCAKTMQIRRGLCCMHYERVRRTGSLELRPRPMVDPKEKLLSKLDRRGPSECWPWLGTVLSTGYGQVKVNGRAYMTHRLAYEVFIGPIPAGLHIDHVAARGCAGGNCSNPAHLEAVTPAENLARAPGAISTINRAKKVCPRCGGHWSTSKSTGDRFCRDCTNRRQREWRAANHGN